MVPSGKEQSWSSKYAMKIHEISHALPICATRPASFAVPALRNPCSWRRSAAAPQGPSGSRQEVQSLEKKEF